MNSNNTDNNDYTFLDSDTNSNIFFSIKDLLQLFLRNIHWFILCALLGGFIATWYVNRQVHIYASSAKVLIKNPGSNINDFRESELLNHVMNNKGGTFTLATLTNEIIIMTSKSTIEHVVRNLNLNIEYAKRMRMVHRTEDIYGRTPVNVTFFDLKDNAYASLVVTPRDSAHVEIAFSDDESRVVALRDTVLTSAGRIIITPTIDYYQDCYGIPVNVTHRSIADVVSHYRSSLSVSREDQVSSVLNISLRDASPQRAADVINEVIKVYNSDAIADKINVINFSYDFINERLVSLDSDLNRHEQALAAFKRENMVIDLGSLGQNYMSASLANSEKIEQLEQQLSLANYLKNHIDSAEDALLPVGVGVDDPDIISTMAEYNDMKIKLDVYLKDGQDNNPVVKELQVRINSYKSNLQGLLTGYIKTLRNRLELAYEAGKLAAGNIGSVPEKQIYLADLERVQRIKESIYINLLNKREELMVSQPSIDGNAKVIDEAQPNSNPVSPNDRRAVLLGILLGLLTPAVIFLLTKVLDTKVRFRDDIEKFTSVPIIGEVPQKESEDDRQIVVDKLHRDAISESFRILRPNLEYLSDKSKKCNVCLISSFYEDSGKTFISSNLAASFALVDKKVILVDMDLRKGTHAHRFSKKSMPGVSNYLANQLDDIGSIIQHDVIAPGVDCIFSGPVPPNPVELVAGKRFEQFIDYLRERYELVLLDTVPFSISADVEEAKRVIDMSVIVLRANSFDKRQLPVLDSLYKSGTFPSMGVILNGVLPGKRSGYGYGYGYGSYGYGSSYRYSTDYGASYGSDSGCHNHSTKKKTRLDHIFGRRR